MWGNSKILFSILDFLKLCLYTGYYQSTATYLDYIFKRISKYVLIKTQQTIQSKILVNIVQINIHVDKRRFWFGRSKSAKYLHIRQS